jgi:hypothetical protein
MRGDRFADALAAARDDCDFAAYAEIHDFF